MTEDEIVQPKTSNTSWLWLSALSAFGLFALTSDRALLALSFLLLGIFAFFNNPMKLNESIPSKPGTLLLFSWACGLAGVLALLSAALTSTT